MNFGEMSDTQIQSESALKLWIDGVGCWLICFEDTLTIGNQIPLELNFKLAIVADIGTEHALIRRRDGEYEIQSKRQISVDETQVDGGHHLCHGEKLGLGDDVFMRFTIPSPLSSSACLKMESTHRLSGSVDGAVLVDQTCLLGSSSKSHIVCQGWEGEVVLFRRGNSLRCKAVSGGITKNGVTVGAVTEIEPGDHLSGVDWSFRAEEVGQIA